MTEIFTEGCFFFFFNGNFNGGPRYHAKPRRAAKVSVIARDVLSLANTGGPGSTPIYHAVIDGKAKPLNAPNYLVNRAKCTTRGPARPPRRMTNERPIEYRRFRWNRAARLRATTSQRDETANRRYKLIRRRQRYALISPRRGATGRKLHSRWKALRE